MTDPTNIRLTGNEIKETENSYDGKPLKVVNPTSLNSDRELKFGKISFDDLAVIKEQIVITPDMIERGMGNRILKRNSNLTCNLFGYILNLNLNGYKSFKLTSAKINGEGAFVFDFFSPNRPDGLKFARLESNHFNSGFDTSGDDTQNLTLPNKNNIMTNDVVTLGNGDSIFSSVDTIDKHIKFYLKKKYENKLTLIYTLTNSSINFRSILKSMYVEFNSTSTTVYYLNKVSSYIDNSIRALEFRSYKITYNYDEYGNYKNINIESREVEENRDWTTSVNNDFSNYNINSNIFLENNGVGVISLTDTTNNKKFNYNIVDNTISDEISVSNDYEPTHIISNNSAPSNTAIVHHKDGRTTIGTDNEIDNNIIFSTNNNIGYVLGNDKSIITPTIDKRFYFYRKLIDGIQIMELNHTKSLTPFRLAIHQISILEHFLQPNYLTNGNEVKHPVFPHNVNQKELVIDIEYELP